jgi:hypothetical protein
MFIAKCIIQHTDPRFIEWRDGKAPKAVTDSQGRLLRWDDSGCQPMRNEDAAIIYKDITKAVIRIARGTAIEADMLPRDDFERLLRQGDIVESFDSRLTPGAKAELQQDRIGKVNARPQGYEQPA